MVLRAGVKRPELVAVSLEELHDLSEAVVLYTWLHYFHLLFYCLLLLLPGVEVVLKSRQALLIFVQVKALLVKV
jgi:hypothetical protein